MFHHFHDDKLHKPGQGSIGKDDFYELIKFIGRENILDAEEFFNRFKEKKLRPKEVCFTFDDGIRGQHDVALPVLEDLNIKSFFFVYSSLLKGTPDMLEVFRFHYSMTGRIFFKEIFPIIRSFCSGPSNSFE